MALLQVTMASEGQCRYALLKMNKNPGGPDYWEGKHPKLYYLHIPCKGTILKEQCICQPSIFRGYVIYVSFQGGIWICCLVELSYGFYQGNIFCWQLLNRSICHSHKSSKDLHNFRETSDLNNGPLGKGNCEGKHHEVSSFYVRFLGIYIQNYSQTWQSRMKFDWLSRYVPPAYMYPEALWMGKFQVSIFPYIICLSASGLSHENIFVHPYPQPPPLI